MSAGPSTSAPWLTVIMPTHCGEQWIDASLRSLATEAAEGVEVLVLDSSPTPATLDNCARLSDRLHLCVVERRDLLMWHSKTNFGVQIAESNDICWLH
jgi:hypothetical protein